ncbi:hypothetical protein D1872_313270 [compost metagenome]
MAWTRRFTANINDICPLLDQLLCMTQSKLRGLMPPTIGEGVWGYIQYAHDQCALPKP